MRVIIAAGGTGGHLYPGVALAREFVRQDPETEMIFVGTTRGLETKVLPREGFELVTIKASGVMGKGLRDVVRGVTAVPVGVAQCLKLCRTRRPDLVIGIGGYVTPPLIGASFLLGVKRVLVEPNAHPGVANRLLSPLANLVFVSFPETFRVFGAAKARLLGTPIRRDFAAGARETIEGASSEAVDRMPALLILGGSQGSRAINRAVTSAVPTLLARYPQLRVIHQTGERDFEEVSGAYKERSFPGSIPQVTPFLYDMPRTFKQAGLIVSRAGATTLAEITASGKPAILVPYPYAIHGHQERNALVLERAGAAVVMHEEVLTGDLLARQVLNLIENPARLKTMSECSLALGRPDAAERVVAACRELVGRA
jgi:UDP-N-acetylglucosamine--N-acetylmuramyl-(pentapeptide) pyrophosphoryl-undecaprenol N-acetylglucosamine transferase